jgi:hypothetical protein
LVGLRADIALPPAQTEVIKSNVNPRWARFRIPLQALCNGDEHRPLLIECFDWNKDGTEILIGQCQTSLAELQRLANQRGQLDLKDPAKASKKSYVNSGVLQVVHCDVNRITFLDYIKGGLEIALVIGIDFTASNGHPGDPNSLHFMGPAARPNQYVAAIQAVASVLASYDTDHVYPVYGFGARLPPHGTVSHCFPLNGNPADVCGAMMSGDMRVGAAILVARVLLIAHSPGPRSRGSRGSTGCSTRTPRQ